MNEPTGPRHSSKDLQTSAPHEQEGQTSKDATLTRRKFLSTAAAGAGTATAYLAGGVQLASAQGTEPASTPPTTREPATPFDPETLPPHMAETERQSPPPPTPLPETQRVGYAVVGLGRLAVEELLPAFGECQTSRLVALVSGDRGKAERLVAQYGVDAGSIYSYDDFDSIRDNPAIEVVYIALPNGLHEAFTVRAAKAGKHVLCEKPMANTSAQARRMIAACDEAGRKLMIAYRIQYEPYNRTARTLVREGGFGKAKVLEAADLQNQSDGEQWRFKKELAGGGALPDIGIYCLSTIRFILGEEPTEITSALYSTPNDPRFSEVEESVVWTMRFPSGALATCSASYGQHRSTRLRVHMERGWINLDPAFEYRGLQMEVAHAENQTEVVAQRRLQERNQFATEIDHMSACVINDRRPFTPGEEGLQDHVLMEAIYEAARTGAVVRLPPVAGLDPFRGPEP